MKIVVSVVWTACTLVTAPFLSLIPPDMNDQLTVIATNLLTSCRHGSERLKECCDLNLFLFLVVLITLAITIRIVSSSMSL